MVLRLKASVLSLVFWFLVVTLFGKFCLVDTLRCHVGYGQRGLRNSNEISWTRDCPKAPYCFEAVTSDVNRIKNLIDYPWNSYYSEFFIRSCGGDYGMPLNYHPWRKLPKSARTKIGSVKVNLTIPAVITGYGGKGNFNLKYTCRHDMCVKIINSSPRTYTLTFAVLLLSLSMYGYQLFI